MIFDTLAAMADWADNHKFDNSGSFTECRSVNHQLNDTPGAGSTIIDGITKSGKMKFQREELTVGATTTENYSTTYIAQVARAMQLRTPLQTLEPTLLYRATGLPK